ncbi:MAG: hypothetical protein JWM92_46 [Candidatus Nomurabacteria bacterium]|nr:hypothetical protein [Candidatus Nomurabacteria bacterium]
MENKESILIDWINKGYDICIPGGTGRNGSNAAFDCLGYRFPDKKYEIIVLPIRRKSYDEYKEEQENNFILPYESPFKIIKREIAEELTIFINADKTFLVTQKAEQDSRKGFENKFHRKYLFFSESYNARHMRTTLSDKEPNLGIPIGISLGLLKKYLWEGHRWMIEPIEIYTKYRVDHFPPAKHVLPQKRVNKLLCAV